MPEATQHHYVLTIQNAQGEPDFTAGIVTPRPGATRADIFNELLAMAEKRHGPSTVLFFSLAPNQL